MTRLAPPWALSALAMDTAGNPFPQSGIHFRVFMSQLLGLPVAPLMVYRFTPLSVVHPQPATDLLFVDSRGKPLTLPFTVTSDNPVDARFPADARPYWCSISAKSGSFERIGTSFVIINPPPVLRLDAMLNTPHGAASICASDTRLEVAASHMDFVRISGSGTVVDAQWLNVTDPIDLQSSPWRVMGLPRGSGARYSSSVEPEFNAKLRVTRGTPQRHGLHLTPDGVLLPTTSDDEWARVESAQADLWKLLDAAIDDVSRRQEAATVSYAIPGATNGIMEVNALGALLQAGLDPTFARWLGFMDLDDEPLTDPGDLIAYLIRGFWRIPYSPTMFDADPLRMILRHPSFAIPASNVLSAYAKIPIDWKTPLSGDYLDLMTVAVATVGGPPRLPDNPLITSFEDRGFLPARPPAARREIAIDVERIVAGAGIAFAKRDASGAIVGLNQDGMLIAPGTPKEADRPGMTRLFDRTAPPESVSYLIAQSDWAGRWSGWGEGGADAKARPPMPAPVPMWRALPLTVTTAAEVRQIEARVPSVDIDSLPPGSSVPSQVRVYLNGAAAATAAITNPETVIAFNGPAVARSASVTVRLTAEWLDASGQRSRMSAETQLDLADPRTPPQVTLPTNIQYGSRPDATGRSRITLGWNASPVQRRFRVYYTDETAILGAIDRVLNDPAPTTHPKSSLLPPAATALRSAFATLPADPVTRAALFTSHGNALVKEMFTQLTGTPIETPPNRSVSFSHDVSGSLRGLSFYRIVAVSEANVESDFATAPMFVAAVPNTMPPARPQLSVSTDTSGNPLLTVDVPNGSTPPVEVRVRRAIGRADDPLLMPVVETRVLPAPSPAPPRAAGEPPPPLRYKLTPAGTLRNWERYFWRVEVRGRREPGSGPDAAWSDASLPAVLPIIPPPPPPPASVTATSSGTAVTVRWQHPLALKGGSMGRYRFEIYRTSPGQHEAAVGQPVAAHPMPAGGFTFIDAAAPPKSSYRVMLIDPIGRTSISTPAPAV